jgi:peptidoglycan hydrolase-like protein with peptidoglycan-binding domain
MEIPRHGMSRSAMISFRSILVIALALGWSAAVTPLSGQERRLTPDRLTEWQRRAAERIFQNHLTGNPLIGARQRSQAARAFERLLEPSGSIGLKERDKQLGFISPALVKESYLKTLKDLSHVDPSIDWSVVALPGPVEGPAEERAQGPSATESEEADDVQWAQKALNEALGTALDEDGVVGPQTKAAILQFQRTTGLPATGSIDADTRLQLAVLPTPAHFLELDASGVTGGTVIATVGASQPVGVQTREDLAELLSRYEPKYVVYRGDELPPSWAEEIVSRNTPLIRWHPDSPKKTIGEVRQVALRLNGRLTPDRTVIFNALPQERGTALPEELSSMGMPRAQAPAWEQLQRQIQGVIAPSGFDVQTATKEAILSELGSGDKDVLILFGHFSEGEFSLPGGSRLSTDEIAAVQREQPAARTVWLISCETGSSLPGALSPATAMLQTSSAMMVIAPEKPVSAASVPAFLEKLLIQGRPIGEAYPPLEYNPIVRRDPPEGERWPTAEYVTSSTLAFIR